MPRWNAGACVHCRQMKLRCDAPTLFPASCSRCARKNIHCSIDPSFKRVAKRERLDAVERELREIKQRVGSSSDLDKKLVSNSPAPGDSYVEADNSTLTGALLPDLTEKLTSKAIGDLELDTSSISALLDQYYSHYHNQFPLISERAMILARYDSCPILFWTIMKIAAKESPEHRHLYPALASAVEGLASTVNPPSSQSLYQIQALLLLCYWPLPFGASITDYSWTYCGLAINYALSKGLHRPSHLSDFAYNTTYDQGTMNERRKTWIACFIVSHRMSTRCGIPSMMKLDHSITEALGPKPSWLPDTLYHQLHIAHQGNRFCETLGNNETTSTGFLPRPAPLIQMFDRELRAQEARFASEWQTSEYIFFMATKLQLFSFALTAVGLEVAEDMLSSETYREFFAHAYLTAMRLLQSVLQSSKELPYWPEHQTRYILDAVLFLLKLIGCSYEFVDEVAARNVIRQTWDLLHSRSEAEDDHLSRLCAVIEYLSCNRSNEKSPAVKVRSRLASNLTIDSAWRARDRFSEAVRAKRPTDYTSAAALERCMELDLQYPPSFLGDIGDWDFLFDGPGLQGAMED